MAAPARTEHTGLRGHSVAATMRAPYRSRQQVCGCDANHMPLPAPAKDIRRANNPHALPCGAARGSIVAWLAAHSQLSVCMCVCGAHLAVASSWW